LRAGAVFRHGFQISVADGELHWRLRCAMENFSQALPIQALAR
jgi:hypothetical protein